MKTILKIIGSVIAIFIILFAITAIVLVKIVDPNDFKSHIDQYALQKTGRHLLITGNVGWSFIPWLGIDLKGIQLSNPTGFPGPNLANIGEIKVNVRFWPLLVGKIHFGKIIINNAQINLIKNKMKMSNWAMQRLSSVQARPTTTAIAPTNPAKRKSPDWSSYEIAGIAINQAKINLINQNTNTTTSLRNFNLTTSSIQAEHPFKLSLYFLLQPNVASPTTVTTHITGMVNANPSQQIFQLINMQLNALIKRPHLPNLPMMITGSLAVHLRQQTLNANAIIIHVANVQLQGGLEMAQLLQTPEINAHLSTQNAALQPFVTALRGQSFMKGRLSFHTNITTHGETQQQMLAHLNGQGSAAVTDGAVLGVNIANLLAQGEAFLNKKTMPISSGPAATPFSRLAASYTIEQGIVHNNDLTLNGGEIHVTGNGTANLVNRTIDYTLTAQYTKRHGVSAPLPWVLPLRITGKLNAPTVKPDFNNLARKIIIDAIKKKIEKYTGIGKKFDLNKFFHFH